MLQGLRKAIVRGDYKPGQSLPGIRELSAGLILGSDWKRG